MLWSSIIGEVSPLPYCLLQSLGPNYVDICEGNISFKPDIAHSIFYMNKLILLHFISI